MLTIEILNHFIILFASNCLFCIYFELFFKLSTLFFNVKQIKLPTCKAALPCSKPVGQII